MKGGRPASTLQLKVAEVLRDGEWHRIEELVAKAGKVIPPGVAIRRCERARVLGLQQRGKEVVPRKIPLSVEGQIETGRKSLITETLNVGRRQGRDRYFERNGPLVRMLVVPPRVQEAWDAMEKGTYFDPEQWADDLQENPHTALDGLTAAQLRRLISSLVDRLGEPEDASWGAEGVTE